MAGEGDMQAHEQTYNSVINLLKYGAVICFLIAFFVIWLIAG
ncbi:aa3-type cytochrome c oxidase subunit IV [Stakelama marina]|uniref:Aa3-type cytochrome c oxidase subunit IV n=1 Tax=Stakelama marina TaxID=2826939 RepID=A0A8T4IGW0_9SPHN|nr:aa3-type cytochrome c oxidase subunit IV [Stakelama marina]MBR0553863.1 aa3-type cytochrome c oxidase subunit IV [Stakelama marina]